MCLSRSKSRGKNSKQNAKQTHQKSKQYSEVAQQKDNIDSNVHENINQYSQTMKPSKTMGVQRLFKNNQNIINQQQYLIVHGQKTDEEFYNSLEKYRTLCFSGQGYAFFLPKKQWTQPLGGLFTANIFLALSVILLIVFSNKQDEIIQQSNSILIIVLADIFIMILLNISFLLTLLMNPGIRNLTKISDQKYQNQGKVYCSYCSMYRTQQMRHCRQCKVCVQNLDHHCGYFNKCIAGYQQYAFNLCLLMLFCTFLATFINFILIIA